MMALADIRDSFDIDGEVTETPMSRTHQYRKVMKPMLERKRRARINKCLDELKDLMVHALQTEGESITKLEKADVLELTVRHLRKLRRQQMLTLNPALEQDRYHTGFAACATEVSRCLAAVPSVEAGLRSKLMSHLGHRLAAASSEAALQVRVPVPTYPAPAPAPAPGRPQPKLSPAQSSGDSDLGYNSGRDCSPSPTSDTGAAESQRESENVWRPF